MWGLDGRSVLVTGASGGIGGATVRQLVAAGADVVASGRSTVALDALAAETGCRVRPFDLTSEESVRGALHDLDLWGVVNCGGFGGEIASPIVFLLGDGASMITGVSLPIDGGFTAG